MATLTLFKHLLPGVEKQVITEGTGTTGPRLVSVNCWGINRLHLDFDRDMLVQLPEGLVGETSSYRIYKKSDPSVKVTVMRVITDRSSPTLCELFCHGMQQGVEYTVQVVADVLDAWGNPLDHNYDSQDFFGLGHQISAPGGLNLFIGLEAGVQNLPEEGWRPDLDPPYVINPDPAPGTLHTPPDYAPSFDLCDDGSGVNVSATRIWVDDFLIFHDNHSETGWSVVVTPIANGYHYQLGHTDPFREAHVFPVRVYGADLAVIPNTVDYTWEFDTTSSIIDAPTRRYAHPYAPVIDLSLLRVSLTSRARYFIARGAHDGTLLVPTRFVLGSGWENPRWGELQAPSPDATEVSQPVFEGSIYDGALVVEEANPSTFVLRCAGPSSMDFTPTEVMVYATIHNSPLATENYREVPFACATFPEWFHVSNQRFVTRLVLPVG